MCGRNLRFPHTRPLPPLGGGLCAMRVCAANSLACQGLALAMLRFPLTLLFPSDPLGLRAASLHSKLVWLAGAQSRQCPGRARSQFRARRLYSMPGPFTRGGGLHPTSGTNIRRTRDLHQSSGTNIRTTRKPRPLWARLRWGWVLSFPRTGRALTASSRPSGGDFCTPLQERIFAAHAIRPLPAEKDRLRHLLTVC